MQEQDADSLALRELAAPLPVPRVAGTLAWTAAVDVATREPLGRTALGERFIVPITGGRFWGGPGFESFHGIVLAGGADRQLVRSDGIKELTAEYEMQTHDGAVITVLNRVIVDDAVQPRYAVSNIRVTAPDGPHAWLNRRQFAGTLQSLRPARAAVLVRGYLLDAVWEA